MTARLLAPLGAALQLRGGETSWPLHVYVFGMVPPAVKAELVTDIDWAIDDSELQASNPTLSAANARHASRNTKSLRSVS